MSTLKLIYVHNELLRVSANYVAIFRDVKYIVWYITTRAWKHKNNRTNPYV